MRDVRELTLEELTELLVGLGESRFRGEQVYRWLHQHGATSWDEMTNLARATRDRLAQAASITTRSVDEGQTSKGGTSSTLRVVLLAAWASRSRVARARLVIT